MSEIQQIDLVPGRSEVRVQTGNIVSVLIDDYNIAKNNLFHIQIAPSPTDTSWLSIGKSVNERYLEKDSFESTPKVLIDIGNPGAFNTGLHQCRKIRL